ncbi:MAG: hypothetical protein ACXWV9_11290 [Flavisolibacter sp.]
MLRKLLLLISSVVILFLFFLLPVNRGWMQDRVFSYLKSFQTQKNNLDIEHRKKLRFGNNYIFTKNIAEYFQKKGIADSVMVFLPPTSYFLNNGVEYHVPEPTVFYLHTGLKTIWVQSKDAIKANWYVHVKDKKIEIDTVPPKEQFREMIKEFEKYPFVL